jgi:hypothetical protein
MTKSDGSLVLILITKNDDYLIVTFKKKNEYFFGISNYHTIVVQMSVMWFSFPRKIIVCGLCMRSLV